MSIPAVLSIAGSDSSGGAGIQADIKTITAHKLFAETAITALTAQNTTGVYGVVDTDPEFVSLQIKTVFDDIRPQAVKIGMVSSGAIIAAIADALVAVRAENIVLDPVMVATSGSVLIADEAVQALADRLLPLADIVTPNIPEAQVLAGMSIASEADMVAAAHAIRTVMNHDGAWVLVKGGHFGEGADDLLLSDAGDEVWLRHERIDTQNTHGTGCTLSSAIACGLASGLGMQESVERAKRYLTHALMADPHMGTGSGPLDHMWSYH